MTRHTSLLTRRHTLALLPTGLALTLLGGCATQPAPRRYADITFRNLPPIQMAVGAVETVVAWQAPFGNGHVESEMPVDATATAARWGAERLLATGGPGRAVVTVEEMSVVETNLSTTSGIRGAFTTDQAQRYDLRLVMRVRADDPVRLTTAETIVTAERSRTVPEGLTLAEREGIWYDTIEQLMRDMDARLSDAVRREMTAFVLSGG